MKTENITPEEDSSFAQDVGSTEKSSPRGSVVDQTSGSLSEQLQIFPTDLDGKRRATAIGFIESGGDDRSLHDLL